PPARPSPTPGSSRRTWSPATTPRRRRRTSSGGCHRWPSGRCCPPRRWRPPSTTPSRRPGTPRRAWSRRWRSWASAGRRRTRPSCMPARPARTCPCATRRSSRLCMDIGSRMACMVEAKVDQDRGYVFRRGQTLIPSFTAFAVVGLLERHYPRLVDYDFTASMEDQLDEIAVGELSRVDFLRAFYFGDDTGADGSVARSGGLKKMVTEKLAEIDAREVNSIPLFTDDQGREVVVRVGRYGPYLQR